MTDLIYYGGILLVFLIFGIIIYRYLTIEGFHLPTYFGHGIPLAYEDKRPTDLWTESADNQPMFHLADYRASVDCCPSPYTSECGCLCLPK